MGGFGPACIVAGGLMLVAGTRLLETALPHSRIAVWPAYLSLVAIGVAIVRGHEALLHRVAGQASMGARTLSRAVIHGAIAGPVVTTLLIGGLGATPVMMGIALVMLTVGPWLMIGEPDYVAAGKGRIAGTIAFLRERWALTHPPLRASLRKPNRPSADNSP